MNTIWSTFIQKIGTLHQTRQLRFDDRFKEDYTRVFDIGNAKKILEIGAGPGALTQSLKRWYPRAEVIGSDRDTAFVEFAKIQAPDIEFVEADINCLPFCDDSFDVAISNTVQEHADPSKFFGEQYRVLKPGGVCLVLSGRRGINIISSMITEVSNFESEMLRKTKQYYDEVDKEHNVAKYCTSEQELPAIMSEFGFKNIQTHYLTVNLTPDSEQFDSEFAIKMIEANRRVHLDSLEYLPYIAPRVVTKDEFDKWADEINRKYDKRIAQYNSGIKQWDTNVSLTAVLRGVK